MASAHILLLEDDTASREGLGLLLEEAGYTVTTASDGQHAMDLLAGSVPVDLLVFDLKTPRLNGDDVLRYVQGDPVLREVPVILTTAVPRADVRVPADVIFEKPVDVTAFLDAVRRLAPTRQRTSDVTP